METPRSSRTSKSASSSPESIRMNSVKWAKQLEKQFPITLKYKDKSHTIMISMADSILEKVCDYFGKLKKNYNDYELIDESKPDYKIKSYSTLADFYSENELNIVKLKFLKKKGFFKKLLSRKGGTKKRNRTFRKTKKNR
jgi:hypothetical protein